MNINDALAVVQEILETTDLSKTQTMVLTQIWQGFSYQEIAKQSGYNEGYVRTVGAKLLQMLAIALGEKVTKHNLKRVLQRYQQQAYQSQVYQSQTYQPQAPVTSREPAVGSGISALSPACTVPPTCTVSPAYPPAYTVGHSRLVSYSVPDDGPVARVSFAHELSGRQPRFQEIHVLPMQDWGEAIDVSSFCGRETELHTLSRWILQERCRLVGVMGDRGIGKTALSVKLARQLLGADQSGVGTVSLFGAVIWRSLRYPPALQTLLAKMIHFLSNGQETAERLPDNLGDRLSRLMDHLRTTRCLIILSHFQAVLQPSSSTALTTALEYRAGYEEYGELLRRIGETQHQSCLVITSQQKPNELAILQGHTLPVRSLQLIGLTPRACQEILKAKGLTAPADRLAPLLEACQHNPLALKLAATRIQDEFNGDMTEFLRSQKRSIDGFIDEQ